MDSLEIVAAWQKKPTKTKGMTIHKGGYTFFCVGLESLQLKAELKTS
ncbi:hypothetical protein [Bacillus sp. AK031]